MLLSLCVCVCVEERARKQTLGAHLNKRVHSECECAPATAFLSYFLSSGEVLQIDKCDHVGSMVGGRRTRSAHQTYSHLNEHTSAAFKRSLLFAAHTHIHGLMWYLIYKSACFQSKSEFICPTNKGNPSCCPHRRAQLLNLFNITPQNPINYTLCAVECHSESAL